MTERLFGDYLLEWLELRKLNLQNSTYVGYAILANTAATYFVEKGVLISQITAKDINLFYSYLSQKGRTNNRIVKYHTLLFTAIKALVQEDILSSNILIKIKRPKTQRSLTKYFSQEEASRLLAFALNNHTHVLSPPIVLALCFGLRRSEAFGLTWDNISLDRKEIYIVQKVNYYSKNAPIEFSKILKNQSSQRILSIPVFLLEYFEILRTHQEAVFSTVKQKKSESFICLDENGKLLVPNYASRNFHKVCELINLPRITYHGLRHTNATTLVNLGANLKEVQEWLGHSSYQTTADIYTHLTSGNKTKLANLMNAAFFKDDSELPRTTQ